MKKLIYLLLAAHLCANDDVTQMVTFLTKTPLPLSYSSTPEYWSKIEGDKNVVDIYNPNDYTLSPSPDSPGRDLQYERINVWNGTDIYDAATWQIALALAATNGYGDDLFDRIEAQNRLLSDKAYRACTKDDELFSYNGTSITDPKKAYCFRMISKEWLVTDPFMNTEHAKYISARDLPEDNPDYAVGKVSWADWKPITGENAWAFLIGPLQADYLKHNKTFVPYSSLSMQQARDILVAFSALQSPNGGIYYATAGSLGNVGDDPVNPHEISVENNASLVAGLKIFKELLELSIEHEDEPEAFETLTKVETLLEGLTTFFRDYAWHDGAFLQGGIMNTSWQPTLSPRAVDVQTWTITALGPKLVDEWFGENAAYNAWKKTKEWGGFFGPDGSFWGVGYSDLDNNEIHSAEWTIGAITLVRSLIESYDDKAILAELKSDEASMIEHLSSLKTEDGSYLYANKRYFIPFGWYANPLPSTCSTSWALMLHYNYNPLTLGGK